MTYKVCYWDATEGAQKERECTTEEILEIEERKATKGRGEALTKIEALERKITPRRIREAILSGDKTFISGIDAEISSLRAALK